jgi:hypothetical protein
MRREGKVMEGGGRNRREGGMRWEGVMGREGKMMEGGKRERRG